MKARAPVTAASSCRRALACALALLPGACSSTLPDALQGNPPVVDAGSAGCPDDLHASCPTPPPGYATDIAPIVQTHCLPCHSAGGKEPTEHSFATYQALANDAQAVLDQVNDCLMPPLDAGTPLPTTSRVLLLTWLACGAPDN